MTPPEEYELYGDRPEREPTPMSPVRVPPPCPSCGANDFEDGFVEGTESLTRYYGRRRETGILGVKRFGIDRRPVIARRCLVCSHLDLFAGELD